MRVRTIYFKVVDIGPPRLFWSKFLDQTPRKDFESWCEFMAEGVRIALLKLDEEERGNACVPVFELPDAAAVRESVGRAVDLGAKVFIDGLDAPDVQSVVLIDPVGNQFELSMFHD